MCNDCKYHHERIQNTHIQQTSFSRQLNERQKVRGGQSNAVGNNEWIERNGFINKNVKNSKIQLLWPVNMPLLMPLPIAVNATVILSVPQCCTNEYIYTISMRSHIYSIKWNCQEQFKSKRRKMAQLDRTDVITASVRFNCSLLNSFFMVFFIKKSNA